jgi:ABC-type microcin C transport system permease subunit YejB
MYRMRRIIAYALGVASVPVGVGVGLWMALLTYLPSCPYRGLGTVALCAARPSFEPRLCVLCGGAAAALVLLVAIAVSPHVSRVAIFDLAAAAAGIALGVWTSLMTYIYPPCGPRALCLILSAQRFATWQSAVIGAATLTLILVVGGIVSSDFRHTNLRAARMVQRWLFKDLSGTTPIGGPGAAAR